MCETPLMQMTKYTYSYSHKHNLGHKWILNVQMIEVKIISMAVKVYIVWLDWKFETHKMQMTNLKI